MKTQHHSLRHFLFALLLVGTFLPGLVQAACQNCGVVTAVNKVKEEGQGTGMGAVAGGVVGGLVGNQIGSGTGNTLATIAGAAGGAYAGHQVEKKVRSKNVYKVEVKMHDGQMREFSYDSQPPFASGDKVKVDNGKLVRTSK